MKTARRQIISGMIQQQPFISFKELEERFPNVTGMTLRRDIEYFEKVGEIIKVRGGARSIKFITATIDEDYTVRDKENYSSKLTIASKVVSLIEEGKSYYFDSGTTIMRLAELLPDMFLNITTSSPNIALELLRKKSTIVYLIGGILNRESFSTTGDLALSCAENISVDVAFMTPSGYSENSGFTCGNLAENSIKSAIVKRAKKVIMLMDSSKLDKNMPYTFCRISDIDTLIVDKPIPASYIDTAAYPNLNIEVCNDRENTSHEITTKCLTPEELQILRERKNLDI